MDAVELYNKAQQLRQRGGVHDMLRFAEQMGIKITFVNTFTDTLGVYTYQIRRREIFLNDQLEGRLLQMVVAHEIGHDTLHRKLAAMGLGDNALFVTKSRTENEANVIAAHLLIANEEVWQAIEDGYDIFQMEQLFGVDKNLVLTKINEMIRMGENLRLPFEADSMFFGNLSCGSEFNFY